MDVTKSKTRAQIEHKWDLDRNGVVDERDFAQSKHPSRQCADTWLRQAAQDLKRINSPMPVHTRRYGTGVKRCTVFSPHATKPHLSAAARRVRNLLARTAGCAWSARNASKLFNAASGGSVNVYDFNHFAAQWLDRKQVRMQDLPKLQDAFFELAQHCQSALQWNLPPIDTDVHRGGTITFPHTPAPPPSVADARAYETAPTADADFVPANSEAPTPAISPESYDYEGRQCLLLPPMSAEQADFEEESLEEPESTDPELSDTDEDPWSPDDLEKLRAIEPFLLKIPNQTKTGW